MFRPKTIFTKIFLILVLISFVTGMLVLLIAMKRQFRFLEDELTTKHTLVAEIITKAIKTGYLAGRWPFTG